MTKKTHKRHKDIVDTAHNLVQDYVRNHPKWPDPQQEFIGNCDKCPLAAHHLEECNANGPQLLPCELSDEAGNVPFVSSIKREYWLELTHEELRPEYDWVGDYDRLPDREKEFEDEPAGSHKRHKRSRGTRKGKSRSQME